MSLFYSHPARPTRPALGRVIAVFKTIHRAIVTAKTRRLRRELMFGAGPQEEDIGRIPQRPVILGDKWDF
jgi:hypothetical protein